jgi:hypothetical protein
LRRFLFLGLTVLALVTAGVATAGTGGNKTGQACYKGMYAGYIDPATGHVFTSQDACVAYVAKGGTLTAGVDLAVSSAAPGDVTLTNNSAVLSSTYTVTIGMNIGGSPVPLLAWTVHPDCNAGSVPPSYPNGETCTGTIGPGQSKLLQHVLSSTSGTTMTGMASITAAQYTDPVTSNNTVSISFTG